VPKIAKVLSSSGGTWRFCNARPVFSVLSPAELAQAANRGFSRRHGLDNGARMQVSKSTNLRLPGRKLLFLRQFRIGFFNFLLILMFAAPSNVARAVDLPAETGPAEYQSPPPAEFTWNGFYAGINVGGGVDHFGFEYDVNIIHHPNGFQQGTAGITSLGPLGGLQFGFNYELPFFHIVASIEIDDSAAGISGQTSVRNVLGSGAPFSTTFASKVDDFGSVRLRLGYAWGRFLPYLTAGFTFGVIETSYNFTTPGFLSSAESTAVRSGVFPHVGSSGMGIEYAIDSHFTVKTEYLYEFINARRVSFSPGDGTTVSFGTRTMYHIIRLGLNYKFNWLAPVAARY
jgi:outer membrane immunogenic protein